MRVRQLNKLNRKAIAKAGPRYTPGIDPNAPNIDLPELAQVFSGLALEPNFRARVLPLSRTLNDASQGLSPEMVSSFQVPLDRVQKILDDVLTAPPQEIEKLQRLALGRVTPLMRDVHRELGGLTQKVAAHQEGSAEKDQLRYLMERLRRLQIALQGVAAFFESDAFQLAATNRLLLLGEWGTGKTHTLCDLTIERIRRRLPTLLTLAQQLPTDTAPLEAVAAHFGFRNATAMLRWCQATGRSLNQRVLVIVDAVNEGDLDQWKRGIAEFADRIGQLPNVGVILSCRRPFDQILLRKDSRRRFVTVVHQGFASHEFDAQLSFFTYYRVPPPDFPLIADEFSRPLFLQLLCRALAGLSVAGRHRQLTEFASGQKGMTYLLEFFVRQVGREIERAFELPRKTCWQILKGHRPSGQASEVGIAPAMALRLQETLSRGACVEAILPFLPSHRRRRTVAKAVLKAMLAEGLLGSDVRWKNDRYVPVVRFPFQRFADHLVARQLLRNHLRNRTGTQIRRSFYRDRPLGQIFVSEPFAGTYRHPGLASAIMLEFPDRVAGRVPDDERELIWYLPKSGRSVLPFAAAFIDGLPWRSKSAFCGETTSLVSQILQRGHQRAQHDLLEVLVGLGTRLGHPYSSLWLLTYLGKMSMPERDLLWSEFVRFAPETSAIYRLLAWLESPAVVISKETARAASLSLAPALTTTRRPLRDRVTRALFLIGLQHPDVLFRTTLKLLSFNDPYVPERLLAASYGVAMNLWSDPRGASLRQELPKFASELADMMFVPPAKYGTRHALTRDYAICLINLAERIAPRALTAVSRKSVHVHRSQLPNPYASLPPLNDEQRKEVERAIFIDFDNYTIGRLVPGRQNYDASHPEYQRVREQIRSRMYNLGYRRQLFGASDDFIHQVYWSVEEPKKTDRYGKKYSWIAYYELLGLRTDEGALPNRYDSDRPREAPDIDPSFPLVPHTSFIRLPDVFTSAPQRPEDWLHNGPTPDYRRLLKRHRIDGMRGPWSLVEGHIEQQTDVRRVFTFLRSVGIGRSRVKALKQRFERVAYPGNHAIPEPQSDHYTFAGEIPWSLNFAASLRRRDGSPRPYVASAFRRWTRDFKGSGIRTEVLAHRLEWGTLSSTVNEGIGGLVPAPALCAYLGLVNHSRGIDLYDRNDKKTSCYLSVSDSNGARGTLLYVRTGPLRRYLKSRRETLAWLIWGERDFTVASGLHHSEEIRSAYSSEYRHIHRRFVELDSSSR